MDKRLQCNRRRTTYTSFGCVLIWISIGIVVFVVITSMSAPLNNTDSLILNDRPIIGILAQEVYSIQKYLPDEKYKSFIAASYVKYIESGGGRVVPIMIGRSKDYYEEIINSINGIVFPGGATWFNESNGYGDAGVILYNLAKQRMVPVWGVCLGMELITFAEAKGVEHRMDCNSTNVALPLKFKSDFKTSKTFQNAPDDIIQILENENVTFNYHRFCITEDIFKKIGMNIETDWHILSLNDDINGLTFVSSFESRKLPIFGIQFHPEKNIFEWTTKRNSPHTFNAIRVAQYFVNVFIHETRKNFNKFPNEETENNMLIYNYETFYLGKLGSVYQQRI